MSGLTVENQDEHKNIMVDGVKRQPERRSSFTISRLHDEAEKYAENAGNSKNNQGLGFSPAFIDKSTGFVYLSRFSNGQPAPLHVLDGLPNFLITDRDECGKVVAVKPSVEAGFYRAGFYYTREAAANAVKMEEKTI